MADESKKTVFRKIVLPPSEEKKEKLLIGNTPPYLGKPFHLSKFGKTEITIGREEGRDILLASDMVSRHHATIVFKDDKFYIRDEESSNGTSVNAALITPKQNRELVHRDILRFDAFEFIFIDSAQADIMEILKTFDRPGANIVSVYSPKGGCGLTSIALNLAHSLNKGSGKKVAVADLDLRFGNVLAFAGGKPGKTIYELIENEQVITGESIKKYTQVGPGFDFLAAPPRTELAELIKPDHVKKVLWALEAEHDFVIADLKHEIDDVTLQVWEMSSIIYLVAKPELGQIFALLQVIKIMEQLKYPETKVKLVINCMGRENSFSEEELKATLKRPFFTLPDAVADASTTTHLGKLYALENPDGTLAAAVMNLARTILGEEVVQKRSSGVFGALKSLFGL